MKIQAIISSTALTIVDMMSTMETTGARIRHIRKALGLSQEDFGKKLSVSRGAVGNWETGDDSKKSGISHDNLKKISEISGCSVDWILTGKGEPFPDGEGRTTKSASKPGRKLDRTLFQVAHDMARNFEQTQLGGLASFDDFNFLVEKYYNELLTRKTQFENSSEEEH